MDLQSRTAFARLSRRPLPWKRTGLITGVTVIVLVTVGTVIPTVVNHTTWRNRLLSQALSDYGLTATAEQSTGGWLTPFQFRHVAITDASGQIQCRVRKLQTSETIAGFLFGSNGPTCITLNHARFDIALEEDGCLPLTSAPQTEQPSELTFQVDDGAIALRVPWRPLPIIELDGLSIRGDISRDASGHWLSVDTMNLLNDAELSPRHTEQNLALIAPLVSQTTSLSGTVSAQLDPVRIRLDEQIASDQRLLQGTVRLSSMRAKLRQEWSHRVVQLLSQMTGTTVTPDLQLQSDAVIGFHMTPEGIHHTGFTMTMPDVANGLTVMSSGVLQLDEQVDLALRMQLPLPQPAAGSFLSALTGLFRAPLQLRVSGTVSDPQIIPPGGLQQDVTQRTDSASPTSAPTNVTSSLRHVQSAGAAETDGTRPRSRDTIRLLRTDDAATNRTRPISD